MTHNTSASTGISNLPSKAHYTPPWVDMSIIGVAGSSGSGKTSIAIEIVNQLNLPWVVIMSTDSFYQTLTPEQNALAHKNEWDLDSPESIDFDLLVDCLRSLKSGKRTDIPVYSFQDHQRLDKTISIYSPHVVILEGILALNDPRVLEMLDMKIYVEADLDVCLSRRIVRDVRERGRTIEGTIKQWFAYVKPVFLQYVDKQRHIADIIVPRGIENKMAITMVVNQVHNLLNVKSQRHASELDELGQVAADEPMPANIILVGQTPQMEGINTILRKANTAEVEFIFYFDRMVALLIEKALDFHKFVSVDVKTPLDIVYSGLKPVGKVSAVMIVRGGSCFETGLKRTIPDCLIGRLMIQSNYRTGEPELHYMDLFLDIAEHEAVLLLDSQMSSGGAALMAVRVLVDHGVAEHKIVFVTCMVGRMGVKRLLSVFPNIKVVTTVIADDNEDRWMERKYFGC